MICGVNAVWYFTVLVINDTVDDFGSMDNMESSRRQLGATTEPLTCAPELVSASGVAATCDYAQDGLAGLSSNQTDELAEMLDVLLGNSSFGFEAQCSACQSALDDSSNQLSASKTFSYGVVFSAVGWLVLALQTTLLGYINSRFTVLLRILGANDDNRIVDLLKELNEAAISRSA